MSREQLNNLRIYTDKKLSQLTNASERVTRYIEGLSNSDQVVNSQIGEIESDIPALPVGERLAAWAQIGRLRLQAQSTFEANQQKISRYQQRNRLNVRLEAVREAHQLLNDNNWQTTADMEEKHLFTAEQRASLEIDRLEVINTAQDHLSVLASFKREDAVQIKGESPVSSPLELATSYTLYTLPSGRTFGGYAAKLASLYDQRGTSLSREEQALALFGETSKKRLNHISATKTDLRRLGYFVKEKVEEAVSVLPEVPKQAVIVEEKRDFSHSPIVKSITRLGRGEQWVVVLGDEEYRLQGVNARILIAILEGSKTQIRLSQEVGTTKKTVESAIKEIRRMLKDNPQFQLVSEPNPDRDYSDLNSPKNIYSIQAIVKTEELAQQPEVIQEEPETTTAVPKRLRPRKKLGIERMRLANGKVMSEFMTALIQELTAATTHLSVIDIVRALSFKYPGKAFANEDLAKNVGTLAVYIYLLKTDYLSGSEYKLDISYSQIKINGVSRKTVAYRIIPRQQSVEEIQISEQPVVVVPTEEAPLEIDEAYEYIPSPEEVRSERENILAEVIIQGLRFSGRLYYQLMLEKIKHLMEQEERIVTRGSVARMRMIGARDWNAAVQKVIKLIARERENEHLKSRWNDKDRQLDADIQNLRENYRIEYNSRHYHLQDVDKPDFEDSFQRWLQGKILSAEQAYREECEISMEEQEPLIPIPWFLG